MFTFNSHSVKEGNENLWVVESKVINIEREVDQYIKSIRSLIRKLTPTERQKYYNGLLAFIVNEQIEMTTDSQGEAIDKSDYSKLSTKELGLLEEMSHKMQQLYNVLGNDVD